MKKHLDIVLIMIIIITSIIIRLPALTYSSLNDKHRSYILTEENVPYLYDMDSYFYAKQTVDLVNNHKLSLGTNSNDTNPIAILTYVFYIIINIFTKVSINKLIVFIAPIINSLSCIPIYFFIKKRTNRFGAFIAGLFLTTNIPFLFNTNFASFDTDLLLCILPITFICTFIEFLDTIEKRYFFVSLLSFILLVYTWSASFIYYYLLVSIVFFIFLINLIKNKFEIKKVIKIKEIKLSLLFLLICTICLYLLRGTIGLSVISNMLAAFKGSTGFKNHSYPDPGLFVNELKKIPLLGGGFNGLFDVTNFGLINRLGGIFFVLLIISSIIVIIFKLLKKDKNYKFFVTVLLWIFGGFISTLVGSRFMKILVIPVSLLIGYFTGFIYEKMGKNLKFKIMIPLLILCAFYKPLTGAFELSKYHKSSVDDSINLVTNFINKNYDKDDVIASWWDYGYYYLYETKNKVLFHGGTFSGRYLYWVSKAFMTNDDKLSSGIFKMLAKSGTDASVLANKLLKNEKSAAEMIEEILISDKPYEILVNKYKLSTINAKNLLKLIDNDKRVIVLITSDMISKISSISYYGNWNFESSNSLDKVPNDSILYKLYYTTDNINRFIHQKEIYDDNNNLVANIWIIK